MTSGAGFGLLFGKAQGAAGGGFGVGTVIAILAVIAIVYLLVRKNKYDEEHLGSVSAVRAAQR